MISMWFKKIKTEICWLTKRESLHALAGAYLVVGATILGMIWSVNLAIKEDPENKTKIERTGYFESIGSGGRSVRIILSDGETYRISPHVCGSSAFNLKKFEREVEYGDELHLAVFQEDEMRYIYQLERNGEEYLSYEDGFRLAREENMFMVFMSTILFIFSVVLLVTEYLKLRQNELLWDKKPHRRRKDMEFYYLSKYPIRLCRDYIRHSNIYDRFIYTWEEREGCYLITFKEYRNSTFSMSNARKPVFKVMFEDLGEQTGVRVQFMNPGLFIRTPSVNTIDIDLFWENKLDAEKMEREDAGDEKMALIRKGEHYEG